MQPDQTYHIPLSNKDKVDYICQALRLEPFVFNLDLEFPLEDWAISEDASLMNCGLYVADLRRQFYVSLINEKPELKTTTAFGEHAEAEFWQVEFNRVMAKRSRGVLLAEWRVLN